MPKNRCKELRGNRSQQDIAVFLGLTQQAYSNIEKSDKCSRELQKTWSKYASRT